MRYLAFVVLVVLLCLCCVSATVAAPFDSPKGVKGAQGKEQRKEKVKLEGAEKKVLAQYEEVLAQCVRTKTQDIEKLCTKRYPDTVKRKPQRSKRGAVAPTPSPKPGSDKIKLSSEARGCIRYHENAAALTCVDRVSRRTPAKIYDFWLSRNQREIERIQGQMNKNAQYRDPRYEEWIREFD